MSNLKFTGRGFSQAPLSEDELAELRERAKHYDDHFLGADEFLAKTGLAGLASFMRGFIPFLRAAVAVTTLAGAIAALKTFGVF